MGRLLGPDSDRGSPVSDYELDGIVSFKDEQTIAFKNKNGTGRLLRLILVLLRRCHAAGSLTGFTSLSATSQVSLL